MYGYPPPPPLGFVQRRRLSPQQLTGLDKALSVYWVTSIEMCHVRVHFSLLKQLGSIYRYIHERLPITPPTPPPPPKKKDLYQEDWHQIPKTSWYIMKHATVTYLTWPLDPPIASVLHWWWMMMNVMSPTLLLLCQGRSRSGQDVEKIQPFLLYANTQHTGVYVFHMSRGKKCPRWNALLIGILFRKMFVFYQLYHRWSCMIDPCVREEGRADESFNDWGGGGDVTILFPFVLGRGYNRQCIPT